VRTSAEAYRQLRADQARLTAELAELRQAILAAEGDAPDPLVPSWATRQFRQRVAQIQEALEELRIAIFTSNETLEVARSLARGELRPGLRQEARLVLTAVLEVAEASRAAQTAIEELAWRARRLGISLPLARCTDQFLDARIGAIHKAIERLRG
jgi:hypothetical protein